MKLYSSVCGLIISFTLIFALKSIDDIIKTFDCFLLPFLIALPVRGAYFVLKICWLKGKCSINEFTSDVFIFSFGALMGSFFHLLIP